MLFPSFLNFLPLEYPGRGTRIHEALRTDIHAIVDDLFDKIKVNLGVDYALYGHSMGGIITYLLAKKVIAAGCRPPLHLFITGTPGPASDRERKKSLYLLNKTEFLEEVGKLRGLPDEILADSELVDFFEPVLRADFKVSETYLYEETEPMDVPITVITGTEEDMKQADIRLWQRESSYEVDFRVMRGHHFFIFSSTAEIVNIIVRKLISSQKYYQY
jgi:surfactin synthase thioesterase subunit